MPLADPKNCALLRKVGTAKIWSQIVRAYALLVSGATERHPARWPSWGRRLRKTSGPLFSGFVLYRAPKRKSIIPDISHVLAATWCRGSEQFPVFVFAGVSLIRR